MPKTIHEPQFLSLQRQQLDARLKIAKAMNTPRGGWIRTIRQALGMTNSQLAKRLGMTAQGAQDLERRENDGSITLAKLNAVADALNCELRVALVPKSTLEEVAREQAILKARSERNRLVHTMGLEAQAGGLDTLLDERKAVDNWLTSRIAHLWD